MGMHGHGNVARTGTLLWPQSRPSCTSVFNTGTAPAVRPRPTKLAFILGMVQLILCRLSHCLKCCSHRFMLSSKLAIGPPPHAPVAAHLHIKLAQKSATVPFTNLGCRLPAAGAPAAPPLLLLLPVPWGHPPAFIDDTCQQVVFPHPCLGGNPRTPGWGNPTCCVTPRPLWTTHASKFYCPRWGNAACCVTPRQLCPP